MSVIYDQQRLHAFGRALTSYEAARKASQPTLEQLFYLLKGLANSQDPQPLNSAIILLKTIVNSSPGASKVLDVIVAEVKRPVEPSPFTVRAALQRATKSVDWELTTVPSRI